MVSSLGPDVVARETAALEIVAPIEIPTPILLGCDATGTEAGMPALLMTKLDGKRVWERTNRECRCRGMAEALDRRRRHQRRPRHGGNRNRGTHSAHDSHPPRPS